MLERELISFENEIGIKFERDERIKNKMWREIDNISMWYENEDYSHVADMVFYIDNENNRFEQEWFSEAIPMKFENMEIMVPVGYDKILRGYYGNYNEFVKFSGEHNYPFYKHMQKELLKQIRTVGFRGSVDMFCEEVSSGRLRV